MRIKGSILTVGLLLLAGCQTQPLPMAIADCRAAVASFPDYADCTMNALQSHADYMDPPYVPVRQGFLTQLRENVVSGRMTDASAFRAEDQFVQELDRIQGSNMSITQRWSAMMLLSNTHSSLLR